MSLKQQRGPLPFLLYLSFFYEHMHLVHQNICLWFQYMAMLRAQATAEKVTHLHYLPVVVDDEGFQPVDKVDFTCGIAANIKTTKIFFKIYISVS